MEIDPDDPKGSMLNLKDSSLKRGWRKQRDEEQANDTKCGLGRCTPDALQCCGAMAAFTAVYSISGLITTALQSYVASQITALERHFGFTSSMTGFIVSSNEIGFLSVTILFSYFVRNMHIPRMLSASTFMYGVSGLMCVIPFLLTRDEVTTPSSANFTSVFQTGPLCAVEATVATTPLSNLTETIVCKEKKFSYVQDPTMRKIALAIISSGMIIQGICKAPRSSGLATYVDDNVAKTKTPMYISIIFGCAICAAALAFGLGGIFSQTFITLEPTGLTPMHPRWVGAWWMGFLVFGAAAMFFSLPLMCFPRKMKKAPERHDKPIKISGFLAAVARLLTNPVYFSITLANCLVLFSLGGIMAFLPKYLETQFTMPSWKTNIILGGTSIVTNCAGTMVGGIVISKWKLTPLTCLKIGVVSVAFSVFLQTAAVFLGCPNPIISKGSHVVFNRSSLNMTYGPVTTTASAPLNCNGDCGCNDDVYFPMCGADGTNYFNPCFAGCRKFNRTAYTYSDCSCVAGSEKTAKPGLCDTDCPFFYPFIGMSVVGGLVMSATAMPIFISIIRSVSEEDKPVSLGMGGFLNTLLGFLPGPIFFGWLIDKACIHWNAGCGNTGSCALYDIELFRYFVMGVPAAVRVLTLLLYVFALCMAMRPGSYYRKYEEEHGTEDETIKMNTQFRS